MARLDHYLDCEDYQDQPASNYEGFTAFSIENDDHPHYFSMTDPDGEVLLISEGYTSEAGRNNGIESVMRNRDIVERYVVRQDEESGQWNVCLLAGNKQEIARSCGFDTEEEAAMHLDDCLDYNTARRSVRANNRNVDEYLLCDAYVNRGGTDQVEGFSLFQQEDSGQYYFSMLDRTGNVLLISEGYPTEAARDKGVQSVIRNRDIRKRYSIRMEGEGLEFVSLRAGNNQEIARSCGLMVGTGEAWIARTMAWNVAEGSGRLPPLPDPLPYWWYNREVADAAESAAIHDDYLPCEAYAGHERSAKNPDFTTFFHEESAKHYFAWVGEEGNVILKSEGYPTPSPRDNGIRSVIKNRDIEGRWSEKEDEHGYYLSLKAGNHQEIGRSCHYREKGAGWGWLTFAAVATRGLESTSAPVEIDIPPVIVPPPVIIETKKVEPEIIAAAIAPAVVETARVVTPAPDLLPPVAAPSDGCAKYWWLLPLLLLLGLLWWLTKDGCSKKAEVPVVAPPKVEAPAQTTAPAPPPPPPAPVCDCNASQDPLFNLSTCTNPKSLTRLGTNPEFGNSHGLTPAQFHEKLMKKCASNSLDKAFMDRVYKGMGYANGWADAKADQFSETEVAPGTVGNMGYSKLHKTACDRLDATGKDLLAFRIKSANGCDMHFMKTCGNHFFFCTAK